MTMQPTDVVEAFIDSRRARHMSPKTIEWYGWILRSFARAVPSEPNPDRVDSWLASAPSAASARTWLRALRACYRWAELRHNVPNPTRGVEPPPRSQQLPRVFTTGELRRIFAAARDPRDVAAITALLDTGVRIGELASLQVEHIEIDETGELAMTVRGKTGQRRVPISPETRAALMRIAPPGGPVFVWGRNARPMAVGTLNLRIRQVIADAGVTGRKVGPHTFRHTFATMYLRAGGDIHRLQRILGHSSLSITMVYLHLSDPEAWSEHARLSPLHLLKEQSA